MPTRLAVVRAVAAALGTARTEDEVADAVLNAVGTHLDASTATLWLLTADGTHVVLAYERNADPEAIARFARIPIAAELPGPQVIRTGEPIFIRSTADRDERWPAIAGTPTPSEALAVLPLSATGEALGVVAFGFPDERDFDGQDRVALMAVADQCAIALDRARLYQAARADAVANHLLARVAAVGVAGGWERAAAEIAAVCTDGFVDTCLVYVREGGLVRRVAGASRSYPEVMRAVVDRFPTPISSSAANATAIRENRGVRIPPLGPEAIAAASPAAEYRHNVGHVRFGDGWALPLVHAGQPFGAMVFAVPQGHELDGDRLRLAHQVAERAAAVMRSAAEFADHRAALSAVHEVLLPPGIPSVRGFDVAACYVPFVGGPSVGGDWWDVLTLPDGRTAATMGDVAGHGVAPVAVTGQLRNTMRSRLVAGLAPSAVLHELSELLAWTHPMAHATAIVAVADPDTGALAWSSAGHPPPLVTGGGEPARFLEAAPAPPLGVVGREAATAYADHETELAPGARLHLYTDGLVEGRTRGIDDGLAALAAAAVGHDDRKPLQVRCEELIATLVERPEDDICLVIAERSVPGAP